MRKSKTYDLVLIAMYASMFLVVDYLTNAFIPSMPNGGSVGFSATIILLASYQLGWKKGFSVAMLSIPLGFITGQMHIAGFPGLMLDYVIPFGAYGLAVLFPNYKNLYTGIIITNFVRFVSHTIAGMVLWQTPLLGSIAYNGPYMLATAIVTLLLVPIFYKALIKVVNK